jgi:tetratricopeptide (TPR) repeat protein
MNLKATGKNEGVQFLKSSSEKDITLAQLRDRLQLGLGVLALVAGFYSDNPRVSWLSLLVGVGLIAWLLWRAILNLRVRLGSLVVLLIFGFVLLKPRIMSDLMGIKFPPAKPGQSLIILADFQPHGSKRYDIQQRIDDRLKASLQISKTPQVLIKRYDAIADSIEAERVGTIHNALLVIWGWYDDAGFNAHFTITNQSDALIPTVEFSEIPCELKDFSLYIRDKLPAQMAFFGFFTVAKALANAERFQDATNAFEAAKSNIRFAAQDEAMSKAAAIAYDFGALLYLIKGNVDQAIENESLAIKSDSLSYAWHNNRAQLHALRGEYEKSIQDYSARIRLGPASAKVFYNRGISNQKTGREVEAIQDYRHAIRLDTNYSMAYNNLAIAFVQQEQADSAIYYASKTLQKDRHHIRAYFTIGNAYLKRVNRSKNPRDLVSAIMNLETYVRLEPNQSQRNRATAILDSIGSTYTLKITRR